ncbi:uncharacterized protein BCR38DRAFT_355777 [Pseudomassariella vexata]|uniref:Zn(2)-C6 fungal-type domain-containing protein n=1 Tax=Pseudomassariella vexata TaxID=1141098 RepID=A0A1Y2DBQ8_9PEZI|nr:uncharacterized protein BCR38DRAFT_355777 [Pseudomassariella vexata]ORY56702.1 hypothetical protein BCR38DRAFT_355777 [Pseudomassariella vexata]
MNPEPSSNNSSSTGPATPTNNRKERGAIAAQACENCRARKQRCSEERPKCASCTRMKLECRYREPQPTKKDKTQLEMLEILKSIESFQVLDRLKNIEGGVKALVDNLNRSVPPPSAPSAYGPSYSNPVAGASSITLDSNRSGSWQPLPASLGTSSVRDDQYMYISAAYKMLSWPCIQQLMENSPRELSNLNLGSLDKDGSVIMLGLPSQGMSLPVDNRDAMSQGMQRSTRAYSMHASGLPSGALQTGALLTWEAMQRHSKSYFDTFNLIYPLLDRPHFYSQVLPAVVNNELDESINSTLACLVFALGEVGEVGVSGEPIAMYKGRPSGIKGGSSQRPPGLALFNEARRRMGFSMAECSLENVQIYALAGLYYQSCYHHLEYWRMTISASLACQALIMAKPEELASPQVDLIRRVFWHCSITETCLYLELNLPTTGLDKFEDRVGLPVFSSGTFSEEDYMCNQASHYKEHFASQTVLRRLSVEFHATLNNALGLVNLQFPGVAPEPTSATIAATTVKQLAMQLDQWRGMLPTGMPWPEDRPSPLPVSPDPYSQPLQSIQSMYPPPPPPPHPHQKVTPLLPSDFAFTADLDSEPAAYPFTADIQAANLRSRYYYVKYLIHRPFIFKALHHPTQMTQDDADGVATCLRTILLWPIAMAPVRSQKRLIPCLFFWTQNFLGILIILHLSQQVPILIKIRTEMLGEAFDVDARVTTQLYLDWIRDLKDSDPTARWCWTVLKGFYGPLDDL